MTLFFPSFGARPGGVYAPGCGWRAAKDGPFASFRRNNEVPRPPPRGRNRRGSAKPPLGGRCACPETREGAPRTRRKTGVRGFARRFRGTRSVAKARAPFPERSGPRGSFEVAAERQLRPFIRDDMRPTETRGPPRCPGRSVTTMRGTWSGSIPATRATLRSLRDCFVPRGQAARSPSLDEFPRNDDRGSLAELLRHPR